MTSIAIIGSGPTAIYTLQELLGSTAPVDVTIFEAQADAGSGTPYNPALNDKAMLSNIASIEIPEITETLVAWLLRQPADRLSDMGVVAEKISDRAFYPRLVLGEFFKDQFKLLCATASAKGHNVTVRTLHKVTDIVLQADDIRLTVETADETAHFAVEHVVMATGHSWPDLTEKKPGYFTSPWPASALHSIGNCRVGIRGTSLSAIDAVVAVASAHGSFLLDSSAALQYHPGPDSDAFGLTLMSRKGLLPEADFYHPVPYLPLHYCTTEALDALVASGRPDLLDGFFDLFKQELAEADPEYSARIGLALLTVDTFGEAYFADRDGSDAFVWAATNLAEATRNQAEKITVPWRYAILRMHEVAAPLVPLLGAADLKRFHTHFKQVFADDYATVPHESIARLLALRRAGCIEILKLGSDYSVDSETPDHGAILHYHGGEIHFPAFIEATGQRNQSAADIPFPSLHEQGIVRKATAVAEPNLASDAPDERVETGGVELDAAFRPVFEAPLCANLYCLSLPFLLHKFPFVQGITSSFELGGTVAAEILGKTRTVHAVNEAKPAFELLSA